jgi:hypothetical protein
MSKLTIIDLNIIYPTPQREKQIKASARFLGEGKMMMSMGMGMG